MNTQRILAALMTLAIAGGPALAQGPKEVPLTLEEAIVKALKNNLNVAVEVLGPDMAEASLSRAREIFLPRVDFDFGNDRSESPSTWWLQGSGTSISKTLDYSAVLTQQVPTGGSLRFSYLSMRSETNQLFSLINPYYRSALTFGFTQPLLRNFGPKITRREIRVAQNSYRASESQLRSALIETVYAVEDAYWNLVYARENLKVREQSLKLGRDLLAKTRREVEVGHTAPIEVLNAEATVAQREADILQAEALVRRSEEVLRTIVNLPADMPGEAASVVPADMPAFRPFAVTYDEALAKALQKRPDIEATKATIDTKQVNFSFARNQLLPRLDLSLSYISPGVSGDRILYLNDDPFTGVVVGKEEGSSWQALRDATKFLYNNWSVGLTLSVPIGDIVSKSNYALARIDLQQAQARLKLQEQQIALEVSDAVRNVETDAKRVEAYRVARELAEKRLEAEMKKLGVGLTTNYFVLQYQEALANARSMELKALVDYNLSLARIERVTGSSLETRNITF
jgi:outer membrane protein TolC